MSSRTESHTNCGVPYRFHHYFTAKRNGTEWVLQKSLRDSLSQLGLCTCKTNVPPSLASLGNWTFLTPCRQWMGNHQKTPPSNKWIMTIGIAEMIEGIGRFPLTATSLVTCRGRETVSKAVNRFTSAFLGLKEFGQWTFRTLKNLYFWKESTAVS